MSEAITQLAQLTSKQRATVLARLRERAGAPSAAPGQAAIPRLPRDGDSMPASYLQEQLLFLDRWQPGSAAYHIPFQLHLRGPLDADRLHAALTGVTRRHEALRTTLALRRGEPAQVVRPEPRVDLPVIDLRRLAPQRRDGQAQQLVREAAHAPFELETGPLVRTRLCRLAHDEHLLVWIAHHAVADGQSLRVLIDDLAASYRQPDRALGDPCVQYADYAMWQREQITGPRGAALLEHWRARLADLPMSPLPSDFPRPAAQNFAGTMRHFTVPAPLTTRLKAFARESGATLFMVLLAAYQVLLARWSGCGDVPIGSSVAGRTRPELAELIGPFLNVVVIRNPIAGDASFRHVVERTRHVTLDALIHQDLPFSQLVRQLAPSREAGRNPVFQTMFDLGSAAVEGLRTRLADDLTLTARSIPLEVSQVDIAVVCEEVAGAEGDELAGRFEYRTDLYRAKTVRRLTREYLRLLEVLPDEPDSPVHAALATTSGAAPTEEDVR